MLTIIGRERNPEYLLKARLAILINERLLDRTDLLRRRTGPAWPAAAALGVVPPRLSGGFAISRWQGVAGGW